MGSKNFVRSYYPITELLLDLLTGGLLIIGSGGSDGGGEDSNQYPIHGYIQKGPFISSSSITIQELDASLNPTGTIYKTTTSDDFGTFNLGSQIGSNFVEVIASGYYFDEVKGELSSSILSLRSISDLQYSEVVNVNILTKLAKDRIIHLVKNEGLTFAEARSQTETETLDIFNISDNDLLPFNQMDISQEGESNAILLAISAVLQGKNDPAGLSELISKISIDIETDGTLDNQTYINEIVENSINLDLESIRTNLSNRYESLGLTVFIPAFEGYVDSDGDGVINLEDDDIVNYIPENVTAISGGTEVVNLSWSGVSEAETYNIYWSTTSGVSKTNYDEVIENISGTSYEHLISTIDTTHYYVITGENLYWESDESDEKVAIPYVPFAPENVTATPGIGTVNLSWNSGNSEPVETYNVYWSTTPGVSKTNYEGMIENISGATPLYEHSGLTVEFIDITYYYVITCEVSGYESDMSSEVTAVPLPFFTRITELPYSGFTGTHKWVEFRCMLDSSLLVSDLKIKFELESGCTYGKSNAQIDQIMVVVDDNIVFNETFPGPSIKPWSGGTEYSDEDWNISEEEGGEIKFDKENYLLSLMAEERKSMVIFIENADQINALGNFGYVSFWIKKVDLCDGQFLFTAISASDQE